MVHGIMIFTLAILVGTGSAVRKDSLGFEDTGKSTDSCPVCAFRNLQELAARGGDLQAWRAAVDANAAADDYQPSLLEIEAGATSEVAGVQVEAAAARPSWPKSWADKLGRDAIAVGKGAFGTVFVATMACDGSKVAIKAMKATQSEVDEEADLLKLFSVGNDASPHFPTYFQHGKGQDRLYYIMMEAALGKTLGKIIEGSKPSSKNDKMQLFLDMVEGVAQMHKKHIVHRDLKPANIMISRSCGGGIPCHAKVGDLGLSCWTGAGTKVRGVPRCQGIGGTPLYIAPETYSRGLVHEKNDVWALGLMLYEITFGKLPSKIESSTSLKALERNIKNFEISTDSRFMKLQRGPIRDLLEGMVMNNVKNRMNSASALELARSLVSTPDEDVQGALPECFFGAPANPKPAKPVVVPTRPDEKPVKNPVAKPHGQPAEDRASVDAEGDVDFFVISRPMTDSTTGFIFNDDIVDSKTGLVKPKLKAVKKYVNAPLSPGDVILEVNDKSWASIGDMDKSRLKEGIFGPLNFKFKKA